MQLFYNIFKKNLNLFFANENIKNGPQMLLTIGPNFFFHSTGPSAQTSPELIFHIMNTSQDSSVSLSVVYGMKKRMKQDKQGLSQDCKCLRLKATDLQNTTGNWFQNLHPAQVAVRDTNSTTSFGTLMLRHI